MRNTYVSLSIVLWNPKYQMSDYIIEYLSSRMLYENATSPDSSQNECGLERVYN